MLRAHGGPVRRVSRAWRGDCHQFLELDCVLIQSSPGLNNLQEFDLHYVPRIEYYSQLPLVPHSVASVVSFSTLRVLRIRSSSSKEKFLQFPMRSACTLSSHVSIEQLRFSHVNLSESTLRGLLSGSPVLVSLVLAGNTGLGPLHRSGGRQRSARRCRWRQLAAPPPGGRSAAVGVAMSTAGACGPQRARAAEADWRRARLVGVGRQRIQIREVKVGKQGIKMGPHRSF
nr:unnamed protein product [Digitaria exilis]